MGDRVFFCPQPVSICLLGGMIYFSNKSVCVMTMDEYKEDPMGTQLRQKRVTARVSNGV